MVDDPAAADAAMALAVVHFLVSLFHHVNCHKSLESYGVYSPDIS
jgi:hypothetical protein